MDWLWFFSLGNVCRLFKFNLVSLIYKILGDAKFHFPILMLVAAIISIVCNGRGNNSVVLAFSMPSLLMNFCIIPGALYWYSLLCNMCVVWTPMFKFNVLKIMRIISKIAYAKDSNVTCRNGDAVAVQLIKSFKHVLNILESLCFKNFYLTGL